MSDSKKLSHLDAKARPQMVDVGAKSISYRQAWAQARLYLPPLILNELNQGEIYTKKGSVFQTAIIAGTMGSKKTSELIPFCHPISLEDCKIRIHLDEKEHLVIDARVGTQGKTGVEMEALTAVNVAALTVYDMCKALSHDIRILEVKLMEKSGGKQDFKRENSSSFPD